MVISCVVSLHMGSHVANPVFPFGGRIRESHTEFTGGIFSDLLAALALLDDRITSAPIELAAILGHKHALIALS
jgi:hypothetical protein